MLKNILIWVEDRFAGKIFFQPFFESMNRISIRGMNYRRGHTVSSSGEVHAMRRARKRLQAAGVTRPVVLDVGANVGQYADVLLKEWGPEMDCYLFEPAQLSYQGLVKHFAQMPSMHPVQCGMSKEEGTMVLYSNQDASTIASLYPMIDLDNQTILTRKEEVRIRTLDSFCAEQGIQRVHFLKIDVEGAELDVLEGARGLLAAGAIDYVQFEFGPNNMTARAYLKDFFRMLSDFKMYRILQNGLRELHYTELLEIPLLSNYLAERRDLK